MAKNKKKKKKVHYVDDGSTIADMSALRSSSKGGSKGAKTPPTFKEAFSTYINAVKMMVLPMLATLGIIAAAFLFLYLLLFLA